MTVVAAAARRLMEEAVDQDIEIVLPAPRPQYDRSLFATHAI